jgi:glucose/arabinose dehydrogenase
MSVKAAFVAYIGTLGLAALLSAAPATAQFLDQAPGQRFQIDPNHLAKPYANDSVDNTADIVSRPDPPPFKLPPGFSVNEFASGFSYPRWLAVASNGDVFLSLPQMGQIVLLRDGDGDGKAELTTVFAAGFERPHGLAFHDGYLYVADVNRVWRIAWQPGDTRARAKPEPVTGTGAFGSSEGHWSRNLVFSPDGKRFIVTVGSADNLGEDPPVRATLQSFAADGSDQQTLASGLRNAVGITYRPGSGDLYVVVNERDGWATGWFPIT